MARVGIGVAALCLGIACFGCQGSATMDPSIEAMVETAVQNAGINIEDVAAVVGGRIITQEQVDRAIQFEREHNHLTNDKAWRDYLESADLTERDVRAAILKRLIDDQLIELVADDLDIEVTDAEVQAYVAPLENRYPSRQSFLDALEASGYSEEEYLGSVRRSMLWDAVREAVVPVPEPTDEQVREYAIVVAPTLVGRRSSHILFSSSDYAKAQEALEKLKNGADFEELVAEYSIETGSPDGDQGWDCLDTFVGPYQSALDKLEPGEFSDIVRTRFGYHIILCTDEYTAPLDANGQVDIDAIPDTLMAVIIQAMERSIETQMATEFMAFLEEDTPIAVFDEHGVQVPNNEIGLGVENVRASDAEPTVTDVQVQEEPGKDPALIVDEDVHRPTANGVL